MHIDVDTYSEQLWTRDYPRCLLVQTLHVFACVSIRSWFHSLFTQITYISKFIIDMLLFENSSFNKNYFSINIKLISFSSLVLVRGAIVPSSKPPLQPKVFPPIGNNQKKKKNQIKCLWAFEVYIFTRLNIHSNILWEWKFLQLFIFKLQPKNKINLFKNWFCVNIPVFS